MSSGEALIPLAAMGLPLAIIGTVMITKNMARNRELAHMERMQALKMGVAPHAGGHAWKALACSSIGAGVPIASFFAAWMASLTTRGSHEEVWVAACVVSLVAVVTGGRLARTLFGAAGEPTAPAYPYQYPQETAYAGKPQGDPDMYDVAGRRG